MKKILFFVLCMFLFVIGVEAEKVDVTLNACVDGDTAWFNLDGEKTKFRFLGIDTPESVHPKKQVELYGKDASEYTCNLLTNAKSIQIEYDEASDKTDKYNRHLAWVWVDGLLLEQMLINVGYAQVAYIYGDYNYIDDLCMEQSYAISNKFGIWANDREVGYCSTIDYSEGDLLNKSVHTVTFSDNDKKTNVFVVDGNLVKEQNAETEQMYEFKGWYLNDKLFDFDSPITDSIVLEAKYTINYKYLGLIVILFLVSACLKKRKKGRK